MRAAAKVLTAGITVGLTLYTFWAVHQGREFDFMGPWLFSCLFGLVVFGLVAMFFPMGPVGQFIWAFLGAILFSAYIVYDTFEIIKRYSVDDYVWARRVPCFCLTAPATGPQRGIVADHVRPGTRSVGLYLDILNLFLRLLEILGLARSN